MGFSVETGVSGITVFLQGILSFFSPCVLPLVPLYVGYLAGGTRHVNENGEIGYKRSKVLINTVFFVIGISFAFFLLGFGFSKAGSFFSGNKTLFSRIGGVIVVLFGLYQLGFFGSSLMGREHRLSLKLDNLSMNPILALLMGFTFSFAWTPCVGPALASVLLMVSSAYEVTAGYLLIGLYTLGFTLPFLAVGLFTGSVLDFFKKHQKVVRYTVKIGGILLIVMGIMMFTGWMNGITGYLSSISGVGGSGVTAGGTEEAGDDNGPVQSGDSNGPEGAGNGDGNGPGSAASSGSQDQEEQNGGKAGAAEEEDTELTPAPDFTLKDQFGNEHTLSDYKGKVVFLNFWATWCGYCKQEMPDIQELYEENKNNEGDLVVLGVANPKVDGNPNAIDGSLEEVTRFLQDNGYSYPVVMDDTGETFANYGIMSYPTTFMIDKEGNVFGYAPGMLSRSIMDDIVNQTMEGRRRENGK